MECKNKTYPPEMWEFLKKLPAFRYMKDPVDEVYQLYERYTDGLERGTFAFVYNENVFYSWDFNKKTWKAAIGDSGHGDMSMSTYDTNHSGIVDDSEKLGGCDPSYYLQSIDVIGSFCKGYRNGVVVVDRKPNDSVPEKVTGIHWMNTRNSWRYVYWDLIGTGWKYIYDLNNFVCKVRESGEEYFCSSDGIATRISGGYIINGENENKINVESGEDIRFNSHKDAALSGSNTNLSAQNKATISGESGVEIKSSQGSVDVLGEQININGKPVVQDGEGDEFLSNDGDYKKMTAPTVSVFTGQHSLTIWRGTESQAPALGDRDENTLYIILEE